MASLNVDTPASETGLQPTDSDTGPHCRIEASGGHLHLKLPVQFLAFTNQPKNLTTTGQQGLEEEECDKTEPVGTAVQ